MSAELWGTLAVNDHRDRRELLRQVLLFDRLVIPVPSSPEERERWYEPDGPATETWDPDGLDEVLSVLGSQRRAATGEQDPLAWEVDWDRSVWRAGKTRLNVATEIEHDLPRDGLNAFQITRMILRQDESLPNVIAAIAAYPSEQACARDVPTIHTPPPPAVTGADALLLIAQPLLVPDVSDGDLDKALHEAVTLARQPEIREARAAYYEFLQEFAAKLQAPQFDWEAIKLNLSSLQLARERIDRLRRALEEEVSKDSRRSRWGVVEWAMTALTAATSVGVALTTSPDAAVAAAGAGTALGGFAGFVAGRKAAERPGSPLNGASLFVTAAQRLDYFSATPLPQQ